MITLAAFLTNLIDYLIVFRVIKLDKTAHSKIFLFPKSLLFNLVVSI